MEAEATGRTPTRAATRLLEKDGQLVGGKFAERLPVCALNLMLGVAGPAQSGGTGEALAHDVRERLGDLKRSSNFPFSVQVPNASADDAKIEALQAGEPLGVTP